MFKLNINYFKRGQALVELLVAIGLAAILIPALFTGIYVSREGKPQENQRLTAIGLNREAQEAARSVRERGWSAYAVNGTYHPEITSGQWNLVAGTETIDGFSRQVAIADARRDSSGQIVDSGGTIDSSTKKVTSTVSWTTPFNSSVQTISYYQRYLGNLAFTHTTQSDFNGGSHSNTTAADVPGSVVLTQSSSNSTDYGNKFRVTGTSTIGLSGSNPSCTSTLGMTLSNHRTSLRYTAQESKTVNSIRVYLQSEVGTSPNYRFGIQANSGGTPSGIYLGSGTLTSTSAGWKTITLSQAVSITAGTTYHLVVQYNSGTISCSRYIALRQSSPLNTFYPKTNNSDTNANTLFYNGTSWSTIGGQPIYELDFNDIPQTFEGNPYESNTEISVFGSSWYGERFSFGGTDKTAQSVSFCVRKNGTPPSSLQVVLRDNANSTIYSGTLITSAAAPTSYTCPGSWQTHTFSPVPITLTAGTVYRIIIQTSGGNNNNSYRFQRSDTTNAANYNSITYDGATSVYTASTSSGSSWTDTDNWEFGGFYFSVQGGVIYSSLGDFTSHSSGSFDAGSSVAFNNLVYSATVPANTSLTLQIAINNDNSTWNYVGPDGTGSTFYSAAGPVSLSQINGRYIRYRAFLTSNGSATPALLDASINYSP